ncbi:MAG: hypothetical protein JSR71_03215 [Proteobacteria bacterium]|nr:hypothetical protein [Pseudomonadota bacterium]
MKIYRGIPRFNVFLVSVYLAVMLAASGCAVKLTSGYDEITDSAVTGLQQKTETHLVTLESVEGLPECTYENHKQFYDEAKTDINAIAVRVAAIPKNSIITKEIALLSSSLDNLEKLHKIACLSKDQIALVRSHFDTSYTAIHKQLEFAKRGGT